MRRRFAAQPLPSIVGLGLIACGPMLQRESPIWSNGDYYNNFNNEPGTR